MGDGVWAGVAVDPPVVRWGFSMAVLRTALELNNLVVKASGRRIRWRCRSITASRFLPRKFSFFFYFAPNDVRDFVTFPKRSGAKVGVTCDPFFCCWLFLSSFSRIIDAECASPYSKCRFPHIVDCSSFIAFFGKIFSNFWNRVLYVATFWENGNQVSCMVTPVPPNFHSLKRWSLKYVSDDGGPHPLIAVSSLTSAPFKVLIGWVLTQTIRMTETIGLHARNEWNFVQ